MRDGVIPPRPTGSSNAATFFQRVWDRVFGPQGKICSTPSVKVDYTTKGIFLHSHSDAGSSSGNATQYTYAITALHMTDDGKPLDYFSARKIDMSTMAFSGPEELVAKAFLARALDYEDIDTLRYSYAYTDNNNRVSHVAGYADENQRIHPRYSPYDPTKQRIGTIITVCTVKGGTGIRNNEDKSDSGPMINLIETSPRFWTGVRTNGT